MQGGNIYGSVVPTKADKCSVALGAITSNDATVELECS